VSEEENSSGLEDIEKYVKELPVQTKD